MVSGHPPFTSARPNDSFYNCIAKNRSDIFWKTHANNKPNGAQFMSSELKDLLNCMWQLEPTHRPSLSEVMAHPWMKKDMLNKQVIMNNFA